MKWRVKGLIQKAFSHLPYGVAANNHLRRAFGGRKRLDREIDTKVRADWLVHMRHLEEIGRPVAGLELLEIGTGWYPTLPLCFTLAGAARCHTFDLTRLMDPGMTTRLVATLPAYAPAIAEASGRPEDAVRAECVALAGANGLDETLARARIAYHAPADATRTHLGPESVDMVFSNSVLEHVPAEVIPRMMAESLRVLRPGGIAVHSVNCGDHYAYFDRSITQINYLAYTSREWAKWNNAIQYQNRLRARDFLAMAEGAGFEIVLAKHRARPALLEQLRTMTVAPEFSHYPPEQLACTSIDFVARKPS